MIHVNPPREGVYERPERVGQHQPFVHDPVGSHGHVDGVLLAETVAALVLQPKTPHVLVARPGAPDHVHVVALPRGGHLRRPVREAPRREPRAGVRAHVHVYPFRPGDVEVHPAATVRRTGHRDHGAGGRGQLKRSRGGPMGDPARVVRQLADERRAAQKLRGAVRADGAGHLGHGVDDGPRAVPVPVDDQVARVVTAHRAVRPVERAPRQHHVEPLVLGQHRAVRVREPERRGDDRGRGQQGQRAHRGQ